MYWLAEVLEWLNVPTPSVKFIQLGVSLLVILVPLPVLIAFWFWARPRQALVPPYRERVVVLGASSGTGKEIALQYAARGCRSIALVGRRKDLLEDVADECRRLRKKGEEWDMSEQAPGWDEANPDIKQEVIVIEADCAKPQDVIRIKDRCQQDFKGLDTVHICFGLSALRPLLGIAGIDPIRKTEIAQLAGFQPPSSSLSSSTSASKRKKRDALETDAAGLETVGESIRRINEVNVTATGLVLTALLPVLQTTSPAPAIHLLSSMASCLPAPTRSLYGASKAAQLMLFQSTGLESDSQAKASSQNAPPGSIRRNRVRFFATLPGTILSDFRSSAVDGSPESSNAMDSTWANGTGAGGATSGKKAAGGDGLTCAEVAETSILGLDRFKEGLQEMPSKYYAARRVYPFLPGVIANLAHTKYLY